MKKYRFKKRFYVIVATAGLLITGFSIAHIDKVCGGDKAAEMPAVKTAEAATFAEVETVEPELISLGEYKITYYCSCEACAGEWAMKRPIDEYGNERVKTASGAIAEAGTTIAVDPNVIPYGTEVIINGHTYIAQDCGGAIKGNCIDIYCDSHEEAINNGIDYFEVFMEG